MKFHSTRSSELVSASEAIINGISNDGGLYVPEYIPLLDYKDYLDSSYEELASKLLSLYFTDFTYEEIYDNVLKAYSAFDIKNIVSLHNCDNAYFLELFHGPTLAFKDLALVILPRLLVLAKNKLKIKNKITILTATSGDTGGAALSGFKDVEEASIIVLYPDDGVSSVQEAQMQSFSSKNARVIPVNVNFDNCQSFVKEFFLKNKDLNLSSANSINIARLIPQIVYYYYSYIELVRNNKIEQGEKVSFSIPTGNFGNIFAGYLAKMMGLPINKLICASNENAVLTEFFNSGFYNKNRLFVKTNSPSMDILISSNLERFIYYASNEDIVLVNETMNSLYANGSYSFTNPYDYISSFSVNQSITLNTIKEVYNKYNYLIDPHTAVAYKAYLNSKIKEITVIASTASPYKFPDTILKAFDLEATNSLVDLNKIKDNFNIDIPKALCFKEFTKTSVKLNDLEEYVRGIINDKN